MTTDNCNDAKFVIPPLRELGQDLLCISLWRLLWSLALPFLLCLAYFAMAFQGWWPAAILALIALSFVTYGSTSHDLVHRNLGLPKNANHVLLCAIELLAIRSGHAYQAAHLHHHARYPRADDIESKAAWRSFLGALAEGPLFQLRIWRWAIANNKQSRSWMIGEGSACVILVGTAAALSFVTLVPLVYAAIMIIGGWVIPLATSWLPHDPHGKNELMQTRAFRGVVASAIAFEHLYHLEHHLYPAVPHQNWPKLAKRLDPFLKLAGVKPVKFWF